MAYETTAAAATTGNPYAVAAAAIFDTVRAAARSSTSTSGQKVTQNMLTGENFLDIIKKTVGTDQGLSKMLEGDASGVFKKALAERSAGQYSLITAKHMVADQSSETSKRSVVCSELVKQGRLSPFVYALGYDNFSKLSPYTVSGYYLWGNWAAKKVSQSTVLAEIAGYFARSRYLYILSGRFNLAGWFTVKVGQPVCNALGRIQHAFN
jgi:hypothetical protein